MFVYSLALGTALVVSWPWWVWRMLTTSRYREGLRERLGRVPRRVREAAAGRRVVWLHAVSVGEVLAASRLVPALETALNAAGDDEVWRVVVSTTTRTGQRLARERFGVERVFWFPLDFAWTVRPWLRALRPALVVLVESELWPRLLAESRRRAIPVAVVNARLSDRSFRRARRVRWLWVRVLRSVALFLAQSSETAERLKALGVRAKVVQVPGNMKYDSEPLPTPMVEALRTLLPRRLVVVAGSLLAGEETRLLGHWRAICAEVPEAVLVLAPRHPERFDKVAEIARKEHTVYRASEVLRQHEQGQRLGRLEPGAVLLLDTVGDLATVYRLADVAFVGGSLVPKGGHNPLEPARFGIPVVTGPSFENFREIVTEMLAHDGIEVVHSDRELAVTLTRLLKDRVAADDLGQRGRQVFERESGATARTVEALLQLLAVRRTEAEVSA